MATLTVKSVAGSTAPLDGYAHRSGVNQTFANIRSGAGTGFSNTDGTLSAQLLSSSTSNQFDTLRRVIVTFDTSSIPDDAVVTSATLRLYGSGKFSGLGQTDIVVTPATPASFSTLANSSYGVLTMTNVGSMDYASWENAYNSISLNSTGRSHINKTGYTGFGVTLGWDVVGSFTGLWGIANASSYNFWSADSFFGAARAPELEVVYNVPPTVALDTADASIFPTLTPTVEFTGTDTEGDDIVYEVQLASTTSITNLAINPSFETDDSGWSVDAGFGGRFGPVGGLPSGSYAYYIQNAGGGYASANVTGDLQAGTLYNVSYYARRFGSGGITISHDSTTLSSNYSMTTSWARYSFTFTATANSPINFFLNAGASDQSIELDAIQVTAGPTLYDYFDGSTIDGGGYTYDWTGTAHASTSTRSELTWSSAFLSDVDAGFVNVDNGGDTSPFTSGDTVSYTFQTDLLPGNYYWRVRGKDPGGSNTWGSYTATRSFTVTDPAEPARFFMLWFKKYFG